MGQSNVHRVHHQQWDPSLEFKWYWHRKKQFFSHNGKYFTLGHRLSSTLAKEIGSVHMISATKGGTPIKDWLYSQNGPLAHLYSNSIQNAQWQKVDYVFWWQGESDGFSEGQYAADLTELINQLRSETWWQAETKFIVFLPYQQSHIERFRTVGRDIFSVYQQHSSFMTLVPTDGFSFSDDIHYDWFEASEIAHRAVTILMP